MFTLREVLEALGSRQECPDISFKEAVINSQMAESGTLFIACPGEKTDGHEYVGNAFANGAVAALIQKDIPGDWTCIDAQSPIPETLTAPFCIRADDTVATLQRVAAIHRRNLPRMEVIGLTGSVGKTTTKELVTQVLAQRWNALKNIGNFNNEIGLPLTLLRADEQTEKAVLEMGFYVPGDILTLCEISSPKVGVITNIGMVHAERAGSMEKIAEGKSELVQCLPADGTAILNFDDPYVRPMAEKTAARVFSYGLDPRADIWADQIESYGLNGIRFCLHYRNDEHYFRVPLIGQHSVQTALRAAAVGIVEGLSWDEIYAGLGHGQNQLRMIIRRSAKGAAIIDDTYNASPESTLAALNLLKELDGRKIAVLGDMFELGQYEERGHELVGVRATNVCDELIVVGTLSKMTADAALSSGMKAERVHWFETVPECAEYVKQCGFTDTDTLLVKGSRGMRLERVISALEEL